MTQSRPQRTLAHKISVSGRGYWTGQDVTVEFRPADPGHGLRFVRDDLGAAGGSNPTIPATVDSRRPATRRTVLANADGVEVAMVEHVLAALAGLGVDNCEIGVTATEMPGLDGSAEPFVDAIEAAGLVEQDEDSSPLVVRMPIRCGDDNVWIEARPPMGDGLTIEYRVDYGVDSSIGRQWLVFGLTGSAFKTEIAPARTFVLESEAAALVAQGLGSHVTPRDLLIFRDDPSSEQDRDPIDNSLRFVDECVRHKVLDVVGDLALAGRPLVAHVVACRSGHRLNGDLVEALLASHDQNQKLRRSA